MPVISAPGPLPRRFGVALAILGLVLGAAFGVLIWSVLSLHAHDLAVDARLCAVERADRRVDVELAHAVHISITSLPPAPRCATP